MTGEAAKWAVIGLALVAYAATVALRARFGGWHRWAVRFKASSRPPGGITYRWCSGHLGGAFGPFFRDGLHVTLSPAGMLVRPSISYRLFHPPLLLPWRCVHATGKPWYSYGHTLVVYCRSDAPPLRVVLPGKAETPLKAYWSASRQQDR